MGVITFNKVTKSYGDNLILDKVSFEIHENEKIALIGKNGTGKTTIFNILTESIDIDDGVFSIQKERTIAYLQQIHEASDKHTGYEILQLAFSKIDQLQIDMENAHELMAANPTNKIHIKEYGRLHDKFEFMGGYNVSEKISKIITGLKIPEKVLKNQFTKLSGGEQTLIMLGKSLLMAPDILLMDEPTNHLDMDAVKWLEGYIVGYKGTVFYVSHDRYFINQTATKVIELSFLHSKTYKGNYDAYQKQKIEYEKGHLKIYERQQKEIERLMKTARQMRAYGTETAIKRAQNMEKRIELMDKVDKPLNERNLSLAFKTLNKSGYEIAKAINISKSYGALSLFKNVNFIIKSSEKVAMIGPNGAGKSTIIKMITGNESVDSGVITVGKSVKYAYLEQEVIFNDEHKTLLEEVCDELHLTLQSGRDLLGKYMFSNDDVFKKVGMLSGGEKSRLRLLLELQNDVNLLILDEPTNHLDIESREELEEAISQYHGTMLFISHDRHFINKFSEKVIDVRDGNVITYEGNYDYYKKMIDKKKEDNDKLKVSSKKQTTNQNYGKEKRKAVFTINKTEKLMAELEMKMSIIDKEIIEFATDYMKLHELTTKREQLNLEHEELLEKWFELQGE
ncbi:MAG: ABC-F family ATP-binding cassette domain-containing protein [Clostridiales bacterium]|nr:ABC-F family ATP-binding cassette domain-containing protein [Clostridiales bacterium]